MPFEKILVPVDGSQSSTQGVVIASAMAQAMESDITLVNVTSSSGPTGMESGSARDFATTPDYGSISIQVEGDEETSEKEVDSQREHGAENIVLSARSLVPMDDDRVRTDVMRYREPPDGILEMVDQGLYDLVVMGNGGDERWESSGVGKVAMKVARDSPVSVMVVKKGAGLSRITALFYQEDDDLLQLAVEISRAFKSRLNVLAIEGSEEGCGDVFIANALKKITDSGINSTSTVVQDEDAEVLAGIESAKTELLLIGKAKVGVLGWITRRNEWLYQLLKDCPCSVLMTP